MKKNNRIESWHIRRKRRNNSFEYIRMCARMAYGWKRHGNSYADNTLKIFTVQQRKKYMRLNLKSRGYI